MSSTVAKDELARLIEMLGFEASVEIEEGETETVLQVETPDQALLIGKNGENLRALQHMLNVMLHRTQTEPTYFVIDVAGYRKERQERLQLVAQDAIDKIKSGEVSQVRLRPMNAFERRQIHMVLADQPELETISEGVEPRRYIVVRKREQLY